MDLDFQFYQTPPDLVQRIWGKFKNQNFTRVDGMQEFQPALPRLAVA